MEKRVNGGVTGGSRDWSGLPGELLASIRGGLGPADFIRFAAVCKNWSRSDPSKPAAHQLPWLMLPRSPAEVGATCRFFSLSEGRPYLVPTAPCLMGTRCVGSCNGWVASFHGDDMKLVNPLTGANISLPSRLPSTPWITAEAGENWAIVAPRERGLLTDVVYREGDRMFYGLGLDGQVRRWHAAADPKAVALELYCSPTEVIPRCLYKYEKHLAVHRPSGDLLLILVHRDFLQSLEEKVRGMGVEKYLGLKSPRFWSLWREKQNRYRSDKSVQGFRYKEDEGSAPGAWLRLKSLDGCSLFLGQNQPICLSARDVPELRPDCIFFVGHGWKIDCYDDGRSHVWVYDLKERVLAPYCFSQWQNICAEPLWVMPNLS